MDFSIGLNSADKLNIYQRCLIDAHRILFERLIVHGIDPETFDENVPTGMQIIDDQVTALRRMRERVEELSNQ